MMGRGEGHGNEAGRGGLASLAICYQQGVVGDAARDAAHDIM